MNRSFLVKPREMQLNRNSFVYEEVRKLGKPTEASAGGIAGLITDMRNETRSVIQAMEMVLNDTG